MRKHVEESAATGAAAGRGRGGRFSAGRKREVVMRLLRGEDLELYRPTGDGQRERRTWYRHRGATAICSRRSASWPWAARTRAC